MSTRDLSPNIVVGRVGLAARGFFFVMLGLLASLAAFGSGSAATDQKAVIGTVAKQPFGTILLVLLGLGTTCYAAWRFGQAFLDTERHGKDGKGIRKRLAAFISGCVYVTLLLAIASVVFELAGSSGEGEKGWAAWLLQQPFGRGLVAGVGAALAATSWFQFQQAITAKFRSRLDLGDVPDDAETWVTRAGRIGHSARGMAFALMAWFFLQAALKADASEAGGMSKALTTIASQPHGKWLLAITAAGLAMFGGYSFVESRYRRIRRGP